MLQSPMRETGLSWPSKLIQIYRDFDGVTWSGQKLQ